MRRITLSIVTLLVCGIQAQDRVLASEPASVASTDKAHLGIDVQAWGGTAFRWVDAAGAPANGTTAWAVSNGSDFAPSNASFMINYRVADLRGQPPEGK